ncbi:MAG: hypothetical protein KJN71_10330 [Acidimicrobiia bacterium]|nr:hypothetical protein [Acidimicrobiia bacterium]
MNRDQVAEVLGGAEKALQAGETRLGPTGFWKAVAAAKRDPALVEEFGDRFAAIDRAAFEKWAFFFVPAGFGTLLAVVWTLMGFGIVLWAYSLDQPWNGLVLLVGTVITLVTTHGLAHMVVGRLFGIRFTGWFVGSLGRPQPGVKVDYATYLRTPARQRAWMHASGAVLSKLIPFFALGPSLVMDAPWWTTTLLIVIGVGQIVTDIVWSTKASDWKKYRRELSFAE